ncbi:hypothetical protein SAMN05444000_10667 [Shimia gijangensis]|uniref:Uncharacterized protein n=1 Tax=Shimia gijangensis TaxID=1470563 RepID=A0A1M6HJE7_9RHOB|nr:hypothetical protein SAMN05444000_10667 [Shimia gijangensis]
MAFPMKFQHPNLRPNDGLRFQRRFPKDFREALGERNNAIQDTRLMQRNALKPPIKVQLRSIWRVAFYDLSKRIPISDASISLLDL